VRTKIVGQRKQIVIIVLVRLFKGSAFLYVFRSKWRPLRREQWISSHTFDVILLRYCRESVLLLTERAIQIMILLYPLVCVCVCVCVCGCAV